MQQTRYPGRMRVTIRFCDRFYRSYYQVLGEFSKVIPFAIDCYEPMSHARRALAAYDQLAPAVSECLIPLVLAVDRHVSSAGPSPPPSPCFRTILESPHPYTPGSVLSWSVDFPADCLWMSMLLDDRCCTAGRSDVISVFVPGSESPVMELWGTRGVGLGSFSSATQSPIAVPGASCRITLQVKISIYLLRFLPRYHSLSFTRFSCEFCRLPLKANRSRAQADTVYV